MPIYSRTLEQSVAGIRQRQDGDLNHENPRTSTDHSRAGKCHHGVFVGWPLITEKPDNMGKQVQDIWFSNIQAVPEDLTLKQLLELVRKQI